MASRDYVESLLNSLPADLQPAMRDLFEYLLTQWRFGRVVNGERAENFAAHYLQGKTAAVANAEFKIAHGLDAAPYASLPVLPLDAANAVLPQLKVTRAADDTFIYLSSPVTGATFLLLVEG